MFRPDEGGGLTPVQFSRGPRMGRGGNSRAFEDPLTLEQTFPGLRDSPGGAIIALADDIFDFTGPAREQAAAMTLERSAELIAQIQEIDPHWQFESLGFPTTAAGQRRQLDGLRMQRAAALLRVKGETRPLQVETLRIMQEAADSAYERGIDFLKNGRLKIRLSSQEALGNYIDREVRRDLRKTFNTYGVKSDFKDIVRVNRRENNSSTGDLKSRRPDARIGNVAYDVTLTQKNLKTAQIVGFFNLDFRPDYVIIVRPGQLGFTKYVCDKQAGDKTMSSYKNPYYNPDPYIPESLGEIEDHLTGMIGEAPTFRSYSGRFPDQTIDTEFFALTESLGRVRDKLGEELYVKTIDLAARAKALFVDDPEDNNGKTMQGIKLFHEIDDILHSVRTRRVAEKLVDEDGEVTGD